jgi:uncharacterized RDD family membrane protein YckC
MKCPKCGYLGFDDVERCRNCGYEFSLASATPVPELSIRPEPPDDQLRSVELPLFGRSVPDDEPLITRPSPPRTPLSVRRGNIEIPRARSLAPRPGILDLESDEALEAAPSTRSSRSSPGEPIDHASSAAPALPDAPLASRLVAVGIDLLVLVATDLVVVYFTMQVCGLALEEIDILPKWPLGVFLFLLNGGYLVAFTIGGQTLGKMAVGIKVVPSAARSSIDVGRALAREALWVLLAVPAGLGFLTVLGPEHRGLHDRLSGTRVVR